MFATKRKVQLEQKIFFQLLEPNRYNTQPIFTEIACYRFEHSAAITTKPFQAEVVDSFSASFKDYRNFTINSVVDASADKVELEEPPCVKIWFCLSFEPRTEKATSPWPKEFGYFSA